jgi:hypothetical protein
VKNYERERCVKCPCGKDAVVGCFVLLNEDAVVVVVVDAIKTWVFRNHTHDEPQRRAQAPMTPENS